MAAVSSKLAGRLGVPALVIFILVGILAGSDGPGKIYFDNYYAAQFVGVVALSYILFMGGLSVDIKEVRPVFKKRHCTCYNRRSYNSTYGWLYWSFFPQPLAA